MKTMSKNSHPVLLFDNILGDGSASIVAGFGELQNHEVLVPISGLGFAGFTGWI